MIAAAPHLSDLTAEDRRRLQRRLEAFERSWNNVRLAGEVSDLPPDGPLRRAALIELVKIDLAQRWQSGRRTLLENYLQAYPELGTAATLPVDLILAEYNARSQAGTPADLASFTRRFPNQAPELARRLRPAEPETEPEPAPAAAAQAWSLPPPRTPAGGELPGQFGRFAILKKLGDGSLGPSYLADDGKTTRRVVLKLPRLTPRDGRPALEQFIASVREAAAITHPSLAPTYGVGEVEGVYYVSAAYVEGRPLSDHVRPDKPLPVDPVVALARRLALTLDAAHRKGVFHRHLKPANVVINSRKEPVLLGLGQAWRADPAPAAPTYLAPEQLRGEPGEARSDVYGLGVLLYELLAGRPAFEGPAEVVRDRVLTQEPPPPSAHRPGLPPALDAVCRKALAKEAAERFPSVMDLADSLK
jgi:serine/threonine-protein kinase